MKIQLGNKLRFPKKPDEVIVQNTFHNIQYLEIYLMNFRIRIFFFHNCYTTSKLKYLGLFLGYTPFDLCVKLLMNQ